MMDQARRQRLQAAQAEVRELLKPEREAAKIKAAQGRKDRAKAITRTAPEQRQPRLREPLYLAWIRRLPCVGCGAMRKVEAMHIRSGYPEAGWRSTGLQQKPDDSRTAPGCASCHRDGPDAQHRANERVWWERRGIYPPDLVAALREAFMTNADGADVIARFQRGDL